MGLFDIFRKQPSEADIQFERRLQTMSKKSVNYEFLDFSTLEKNMTTNRSYILNLEPLNYYSMKQKYIHAYFFYNDDHSENYVVFENVILDKMTGEDRVVERSKYFQIEKEILFSALKKAKAKL